MPRKKGSRKLFLLLSLTSFLLFAQIYTVAEENAGTKGEADTAEEDRDIGDTIDELITAGNTYEAKRLLKDWLRDNPGHDSFPILFDRYFDLETQIQVIDEFLVLLLQSMGDSPHTWLIWERKALIDELTGKIEEAQTAYMKAAQAAKEEVRAVFLIESARLLFEQGFLEEASEEVSSVFLITENVDIIAMARILKAYIAAFRGSLIDAEVILTNLLETESLKSIQPQVLLALVSLNKQDPEKVSRYLTVLADEFSGSPEYTLALDALGQDTDVSYFFTPRRYLDPYIGEGVPEVKETERVEEETEEDVVAAESVEETEGQEKLVEDEEPQAISVQTGSYLVKENAEYMSRDLQKLGFETTIRLYSRNDKNYFRVLITGISSIEEAQQVLIKLKEEGFEGFILID